MKVFLAQNNSYPNGEKDLLILAKTKGEARLVLDQEIRSLLGNEYRYLVKDFQEIKNAVITINDITIMPLITTCTKELPVEVCSFDFDISVKFNNRYFSSTMRDESELYVSDTEDTYKELIKLFKQEHKEFLKKYF